MRKFFQNCLRTRGGWSGRKHQQDIYVAVPIRDEGSLGYRGKVVAHPSNGRFRNDAYLCVRSLRMASTRGVSRGYDACLIWGHRVPQLESRAVAAMGERLASKASYSYSLSGVDRDAQLATQLITLPVRVGLFTRRIPRSGSPSHDTRLVWAYTEDSESIWCGWRAVTARQNVQKERVA
jgi:hypothetical protein